MKSKIRILAVMSGGRFSSYPVDELLLTGPHEANTEGRPSLIETLISQDGPTLMPSSKLSSFPSIPFLWVGAPTLEFGTDTPVHSWNRKGE